MAHAALSEGEVIHFIQESAEAVAEGERARMEIAGVSMWLREASVRLLQQHLTLGGREVALPWPLAAS